MSSDPSDDEEDSPSPKRKEKKVSKNKKPKKKKAVQESSEDEESEEQSDTPDKPTSRKKKPESPKRKPREIKWDHSSESEKENNREKGNKKVPKVPKAAVPTKSEHPQQKAEQSAKEAVRAGNKPKPAIPESDDDSDDIPDVLSSPLETKAAPPPVATVAPPKRQPKPETPVPFLEAPSARAPPKQDPELLNAIEQLDKLSDYDLKNLAGKGDSSPAPPVDKTIMKKIMGNEFQKNLDKFLSSWIHKTDIKCFNGHVLGELSMYFVFNIFVCFLKKNYTWLLD